MLPTLTYCNGRLKFIYKYLKYSLKCWIIKISDINKFLRSCSMLVEAIKNRLIIHKYFFGKIFSFNHINYYYFMNHIYNTLNYLDFFVFAISCGRVSFEGLQVSYCDGITFPWDKKGPHKNGNDHKWRKRIAIIAYSKSLAGGRNNGTDMGNIRI